MTDPSVARFAHGEPGLLPTRQSRLRGAEPGYRTAAVAGLLALALSGCGGGGGGNATEPTPPLTPGLSTAPAVSTSGSRTLEQYDRGTQPSAQVSRSSRYTLIPEGATP